MEGSILAQRDRMALGNGMTLRLLSAFEVMEARREAQELTRQEKEMALCSNACLLARALEKEENRCLVFHSGEEVLIGLTVEEIEALSARWEEFRRSVNPSLNLSRQELEAVKKNSVRTEATDCAGGY